MRPVALLTIALLAAALAGCGGTDGGAGTMPSTSGTSAATGTPSPTRPPSGTGSPTTPPPAGDPVPTDLRKDPRILAAIADAKGRAGIVPTEVVIAAYSPVTWDDGSLGCPTKGESYTQATVDGELLLLRAGQRLLSYHAADDGDFAYCAKPSDGYTVRSG